jgi:hypothetical protein
MTDRAQENTPQQAPPSPERLTKPGPVTELSASAWATLQMLNPLPVAESAWAATTETAKAIGNVVNEVPKLITALGSGSAQMAGQSFLYLFENAARMTAHGASLADSSLDLLVEKPNEDRGLSQRALHIALSFAPFIGNAKGYAQARSLYERAQQEVDEAKKDEMIRTARRDCLVASSGLALEIMTAGLSGKADKVLKAVSGALSVVTATRTGQQELEKRSILKGLSIDLFTAQADRALSWKPLADAMDALLTLRAQGPIPTKES